MPRAQATTSALLRWLVLAASLALGACGTSSAMDAGAVEDAGAPDAGCLTMCVTPPPAECTDSLTRRTYAQQGVCMPDGGCHYAASDRECPGGCEDAECLPCNPGVWVRRASWEGAHLSVTGGGEAMHLAYVTRDGLRYAGGRLADLDETEAVSADAVALGTAIAVSPGDVVSIAYVEETSRSVRLATGAMGSWEVVDVDPASPAGSAPALILTSTAEPVVAWVDEAGTSVHVAHRTGTSWTRVVHSPGGSLTSAPHLLRTAGQLLLLVEDDTASLLALDALDATEAPEVVATDTAVDTIGHSALPGGQSLVAYTLASGQIEASRTQGLRIWLASESPARGAQGGHPFLYRQGGDGPIAGVWWHSFGSTIRLSELDPETMELGYETVHAAADPVRPWAAPLSDGTVVLWEEDGEVHAASRCDPG